MPLLMVACALSMTALACGVKHLPPRAAPGRAPIVAEPPTPAPAPGHGRLYLDVVDGGARVGDVLEVIETEVQVPTYSPLSIGNGVVVPVYSGTRSVDAEKRRVRPLCGTPCVVDLAAGDHLLEIQRGPDRIDLVNVRVSASVVTAYRHALGRRERPNAAKVLPPALTLGLGIGLAVTSPLLYATDYELPAAGFLISGAALTVIGWLWFDRARPREQAGSGILWQY